MDQSGSDSIQKQLSSMRMIYYSLMAMIAALSLILYFFIDNGSMGEPDYSLAPMFQTIIMVVVPASLAAGYFVFKSGLAKIDVSLPLNQKLGRYNTLILMRAGVFEAGFFLCVVAAVQTREVLFLAVAPIILFIFILLRPNATSLVADLNLSGKDKSLVEDQ